VSDALSRPVLVDGIESLRPLLMGTRHMAVAGHYGAAHAAFAILEAGGNAVDAGVAAGIALGVLQSDLVNFAGVAPILIYNAKTREVLTISGLGTWPRAVTTDFFVKRFGGAIPVGVLRTIVPAAPDAWITALERFGTMSFGDCAAAAIRFASEGFPMYALMSEMIGMHVEDYRRWPSSASIYLPNGHAPRPGQVFVQRDLGRSLQYMADEERAAAQAGRKAGLDAARHAFYRGDIAHAIVTYHRQNEGLLTLDDLGGFHVAVEPPVASRFGELDMCARGPWCQGPVLLEMLNILSGIDLARMGHNTLDYAHVVTEGIKLAFADRDRYIADPRFVDVPVRTLLSDDYAKARRAELRPDRAFPGMPPAGEIDVRSTYASPAPTHHRAAAGAHDTSHISVIDRDGNVFCATPSDPSYDTPVIPGTGLCPSSRGSQSWADPAHPSCVAPGKRPRLTPMAALAIARDGSPMPIGTPGGDVQAQALVQVLLNMTIFGMTPQQAVEAPRFASYSFPDSFEPHAYSPGVLYVERRVAASVRDGLAARGHQVEEWPDFAWRAGAVCVQRRDSGTGVIAAGADPRRPAYAVGW
jgi:gamma-glutamyltranspeptidase / glutathione hydrolase